MILILNCGSQSIKWKIFDANLKLKKEGKKEVYAKRDFKKILVKELESIDFNISLAGHRVVHGGEYFKDPLLVTGSVLKKLQSFNKLAPLHNPYNILGIKVASKIFPKTKHIAVFDTGFYKHLPDVSRIYPVPGNFQRFGFHGISHEYAAKEAAKKIKRPFDALKIISCHLGGGASITAVKNGRAIDTSMGFTPMDGLMMMTRSGAVDPGIVISLGKGAGRILNYESGVKAVCNESEMLKVLKRKDRKARLALDMFAYRIKKYIGAYYAVLGGCDLLVFTGAVGAGLAKTRNLILKDLDILDKSKVVIIRPNEELSIAKKVINLQ